MRERAELVRRVQAGEVSGVCLQCERERQSAVPWGALSKLRAARLLRRAQLSTPPPGQALSPLHLAPHSTRAGGGVEGFQLGGALDAWELTPSECTRGHRPPCAPTGSECKGNTRDLHRTSKHAPGQSGL